MTWEAPAIPTPAIPTPVIPTPIIPTPAIPTLCHGWQWRRQDLRTGPEVGPKVVW